ncbi:phosphate ABC transporter substrate-binding protein PstS [Novipirellula artificiosorum]|uniref:Phosphate-binding protein PstS n=1 Tax=Novipirellula artificiosorum TaxID=2528016 RepID=A0A5C6DFT0_9BACT|nr:phosphate ABC transporter substrate-binding protein PstS [Novipirellula artificiosorum]TWU33839.1 Phosphate-binding protein PstS precursor [Novipirellula artificiosorum]
MSVALRPITRQTSASRYGRRSIFGTFLLGFLSLPSAGCENKSLEPSVVELHGAGSTFPAPLYERWFNRMAEEHPGLSIRYDEIGSGSGIRQFIDELVDFAASDDPLSDQEIAQVDRGVRQLPMTSGAIVLAYNLRDANGNPVTDLRLSRKAYAGIFLGEIRTWLDEEITRYNPKTAFPDLPIQVEYRLDSSGTTSALTRHLSAINQAWKEGPGIGKMVTWPVGAGMPKSRGVSRGLEQVPGSIGYLSYAYARQEGLSMAILENKAGSFIAPNLNSIQLALSELDLDISKSRAFLADPLGDTAYPIVTYSWILCYRVYEDPSKVGMLKKLFSYGLGEGQEASEELGYVALIDPVAQNAKGVLDSISVTSSADSATAIPVSDSESASGPISQAVIDTVHKVDGAENTKTTPEDLSDMKADDADDVSVKNASEKQGNDTSSSEQPKLGEF